MDFELLGTYGALRSWLASLTYTMYLFIQIRWINHNLKINLKPLKSIQK
jgi:hypothetical protein